MTDYEDRLINEGITTYEKYTTENKGDNSSDFFINQGTF